VTGRSELRQRAAIVLVADERYARSLAVVLRSLLEHLTAQPEIYVLSDGISDESKARVLRVAGRAGAAQGLRWIEIEPAQLGHLEGAAHVTRASYGRLLAPRLLPAHLSRAVYLDTDVLIRGDVSHLLEIDLHGKPIAAARDTMFATVPHPTLGEVTDYFNSGVMVLDLDAWRESGLSERAMARAKDRTEMWFADQDVMNILGVDWHELDQEWNVQMGFLWRPEQAERFADLRERLTRGGYVLHYTGGAKPWFFDTPVPHTLGWNRALARSGWYGRFEIVGWIVPWLAKRMVVRIGGWTAVNLGKRARAFAWRT
jgi:lipopolysaccharide biosynthesis glycosyltransferase